MSSVLRVMNPAPAGLFFNLVHTDILSSQFSPKVSLHLRDTSDVPTPDPPCLVQQ